jgi:hypothetical protein
MSLLWRRNLFEDWRMKFCSVITILLLSLTATSDARTMRRGARSSFDPAYGSALAAANRFLHAWQNQDHESGIVMLADTARQHASPESLQSFFSPGADAAYEIAHGQRLKAGEYAFPLVLFGSAEGPRTRYCKLVVVHAGKDDWAVERLP